MFDKCLSPNIACASEGGYHFSQIATTGQKK